MYEEADEEGEGDDIVTLSLADFVNSPIRISVGTGRCPRSFSCSVAYVDIFTTNQKCIRVTARNISTTIVARRAVTETSRSDSSSIVRDVSLIPSKRLLRCTVVCGKHKTLLHVDTDMIRCVEYQAISVSESLFSVDIATCRVEHYEKKRNTWEQCSSGKQLHAAMDQVKSSLRVQFPVKQDKVSAFLSRFKFVGPKLVEVARKEKFSPVQERDSLDNVMIRQRVTDLRDKIKHTTYPLLACTDMSEMEELQKKTSAIYSHRSSYCEKIATYHTNSDWIRRGYVVFERCLLFKLLSILSPFSVSLISTNIHGISHALCTKLVTTREAAKHIDDFNKKNRSQMKRFHNARQSST